MTWPTVFLILGALLVAAEAAISGFVLLWIGLALLITAALGWLFGFSLSTGIGTAGVLMVLLLGLWFLLLRRHFKNTPQDHTDLNNRGLALVGREAVLEKPIVTGRGTVTIDGTIWVVAGRDLPAGTRVRVTAADGAQLTVEVV